MKLPPCWDWLLLNDAEPIPFSSNTISGKGLTIPHTPYGIYSLICPHRCRVGTRHLLAVIHELFIPAVFELTTFC